MKKGKQIAYIETTPEKQQQLLNQLKMSSIYNIFNTFSDGENLDEAILSLSDIDFSSMTKICANRDEYFNALMAAEDYVDLGQYVPNELWNCISQVRQDYINFMNRVR